MQVALRLGQRLRCQRWLTGGSTAGKADPSEGCFEYPDSFALKTQLIPDALRASLEKLFLKYPKSSLARDSSAFSEYLDGRQTITVDGQTGQWENVGQKDGPLTYRKYEGVLYAAGRLPACYAAIRRVLHEIAVREREFTPKSLLNFGSGVGTSVWAAHSLWADSIKEYLCVEESPEIADLASFLLNGGQDEVTLPLPDPYFSGVRFKRLLSPNEEKRYDIVISAYSLGDLENLRSKRHAIRELWRQTGTFLVFLEKGNLEGFRNISLARETIQKKIGTQEDPSLASSGFIFAPCTHDLPCPHRTLVTKLPCHFGQRAELSLAESSDYKQYGYRLEKFSYIVFKKGIRPDYSPNFSLHRVVEPEKRRSRHVVCKLCTQNGKLVQTVVPKSKGRSLYKHARQLKWGDHLLHPSAVDLKLFDLYPRNPEGRGERGQGD